MSRSVEEIVKAMPGKLTISLQNLNDPEEIKESINKCIMQAFADTDKDEHKTLKRQLSRALHPDRIQQSAPTLYKRLVQLDEVDLPQKAINAIILDKPPSILESPVQGGKAFGMRLYNKLASMRKEYERYPVLLQAIDLFISAIINTTLIVTGIAILIALACLLFPISVFQKIQQGLIWLETGDKYNEEALNYAVNRAETMMASPGMDFIPQNKKNAFIQSVRNGTSVFSETLKPAGLQKIFICTKAIWSAIVEPLPEDKAAAILQAGVIKPLRVLAAIPVLALQTILSLSEMAYTVMLLVSMLAIFAVKFITLAITNLPLYVVDFACFLGECCSSRGSEAVAKGQGKAPDGPSTEDPRLMIGYTEDSALIVDEEQGGYAFSLLSPDQEQPASQPGDDLDLTVSY